jgi:hypothetical protein
VPEDPLNPGGRAPCYWTSGLVLPVSRCPLQTLSGLADPGGSDPGTSGFTLNVVKAGFGVGFGYGSIDLVINIPASGARNTIMLNCVGDCDQGGFDYISLFNNGTGLALERIVAYGGQLYYVSSPYFPAVVTSSDYVFVQLALRQTRPWSISTGF